MRIHNTQQRVNQAKYNDNWETTFGKRDYSSRSTQEVSCSCDKCLKDSDGQMWYCECVAYESEGEEIGCTNVPIDSPKEPCCRECKHSRNGYWVYD